MVTADIDMLNAAIKSTEDGIIGGRPGDDRVNDWRSSLGTWLFRRFSRLGAMEDIDRAIEVSEEAAAGGVSVKHWQAARLANLASCIKAWFTRTRSIQDMRRVIWTLNQALRLLDRGHPHRPGTLIQFANPPNDRAELPGRPSDIERALNRAVEAAEEALDLISPSHHNRPAWLSNLCIYLSKRYDRLHSRADLDRAIDIGTQAVSLTPRTHRGQARAMTVPAQ